MRKFRIAIFLILFLSGVKAQGQNDLEFSGYFYDLPIYQKAKSSFFDHNSSSGDFLNISQLRLKPTLYLSSDTRIDIEYEISTLYYDASSPLILSSNNKTSRQYFNLRWTPIEENNFSVVHFIDRIYLRHDFDFGAVTIGRQRISWGTGRIWNPTDLFNPINPANFTKIEKDGADVISFKYFIGNFTDLNLVFNPMKTLRESNYGFRYRTNYSGYDFAAIGGYFDERIVAGLDFAGNLLTAGVRGEGIISFAKNNFSSSYVKFILGADYQFNSKFYTLIEYHFNGEGRTDKTNYELLKLINGEIINLNKNYIFAMLSYQYHPLLNLSISQNQNINDLSFFTSLTANYSASENIYLNVSYLYFKGNELTEYWYYPNSVYLQAEYYF